MNVGIILPGFSSDEHDWAIPVQLNLVREMALHEDVRVLALRYPFRRDSYSVFGANIYSLGVGPVRGLGRLRLWLDALLTLRRLHLQQPFDVLHAMWADETGLIAAWAGRWLGIPVVVSIAGGELVGFDDLGYGLQRSDFSRWIVGQALRGADCIIVACQYVHDLVLQSGYKIDTTRIHSVVLGVDTDLFTLPVQNLASEMRLVHAASLIGVKDQTTLLRAVAHLPDSVSLDIIGLGPEEQNLRELAANLGIAQRVHFLGKIAHMDLPAYYQRAALNILCSRHEGFGMVTIEAAACGVPTVGTAVGILPDFPSLGIGVPVGDHIALAAAINDLLTNPEKRQTLSFSAHNLVRNHFTIQDTVRCFRDLYRQRNKKN